jgi:hypothetical protein
MADDADGRVPRLGMRMLAEEHLGHRMVVVVAASVGGLSHLSATHKRRPSAMPYHGQQSIIANEQ